MNISIITFHNTSNFGATLQCLALYNYLTAHNQNVEIINYLPPYVLEKKKADKELKKIAGSDNKVKALIKGLAYLAYANKIKRRDLCFEEFINQYLKLSRVFPDYSSLMDNPPKADLYICGSDQIWNPALTGSTLDKAFFLCFTDGIKVSYGASMGEYDIETNAGELRKLINDFQMLSVRENSTAERLSRAIEKPVKTVLDCTLLLDKEDYYQYEKPVSAATNPYLLYYSMQKSALADEEAKRVANDKGLKIIDISPNPLRKIKGSKKMLDIGPGEFLTLIKNAHFVVTNSFHGTVFSILYRKQFLCTLHSTRSGRVVDLLTSLDLTDRIVKDSRDNNIKEINYDTVYTSLQPLRSESYSYLNKVMASL